MKRAGWLLLLGLAASSCKPKNAGQEHSTADTLTVRPQEASPGLVNQAAVGMIEGMKLIEPEYKDTVCWENCPDYYRLDSREALEAMSVRSLTQGELPAKVFLKHRLNVSPAFHAVVVAYQPSENEIKNYLVTFSREAERIDTCLLAADEIAEGLLSAYSLINGNEIERHEFDYTHEEAPETVKRFVVTNKGEIVEK